MSLKKLKITKKVNDETRILGLKWNRVRYLSKEVFISFKEVKEAVENEILSNTEIIITTCANAFSHKLKPFKFEKVIIDEAT